jgi:hypothetical protein
VVGSGKYGNELSDNTKGRMLLGHLGYHQLHKKNFTERS